MLAKNKEKINFFLQSCYCIDCCYNTVRGKQQHTFFKVNPLKPELNPICYLLALLGVHHFLHVSRLRVKLLTFR